MRTLSKKTQYTLRALYNLARKYPGRPVLIAEMATEEAIPKKFLEQILLVLKREGLVESKTGRHGGYLLSRDPEKITIGEVIRRVDGPLAPLPCASETRFRKCDECADIETCGTRMVMREVRDSIAEILDKTTIAEVCRREARARERQRAPEPLMYYI